MRKEKGALKEASGLTVNQDYSVERTDYLSSFLTLKRVTSTHFEVHFVAIDCVTNILLIVFFKCRINESIQ